MREVRCVLHVITTMDRGGAENYLAGLVSAQRARGVAVTVAYLRGDGWWQRSLREQGIRVMPLRARHYADPGGIGRLRQLIRQEQPDVVHAHMPPAEVFARLALLGHRQTPLVISKHNAEPFLPRWPAAGLLLGRWTARRAALLLAISRAVGERATREFTDPEAGPEVRVAYYGIDVRPFADVPAGARDAVRRAWGVTETEVLFGTIARLVPQKALDVLLDAFAALARASSVPVRLAVVGTGPLDAELRGRADRLGIGSRVVWAGFRGDIPEVLAAMDVFALSSDWEGLGLVLLEAQAASRPIVATAVDAIPEVVTHGVTGLLVTPRDTAAFAAALGQLLDPSLRRRLGAAGPASAMRFSQQEAVDAAMLAYDDALTLERLFDAD